MGRVYAVASGKGGVGKTTTTVNLGAALAAAGHEVAVVDADLGMANVAGAFGVELEPSAATVHDVLAGEASVADATYEGAGGVSVVPGSDDVTAFARSDPEGLDDLLDALSDYDFVLLDTGASLTHVTVRPLAIADEVLLVSTTERAALGDTDRTREVTNRVGGSVVGAVLTRVDPANPNAEEVTATLDAKVLEVVPEDPAVGESMAAGEPLELRAPQSQAAAAYRRLAALLSGDAAPTGETAESEPAFGPETETQARPASTASAAAAVEAAVGEQSAEGSADDVSDAVESIVGDPDGPEDAAERVEADGRDAEDGQDTEDRETEDQPDAGRAETEASPGSDVSSTDAGETVGLSDALASAETEVETGADAAPSESDDGSDARSSDSDASVDETDADESTVEGGDTDADETPDDAAEESTVSETILADESAGGLVEEAEPGDDDPRADEGGADDVEGSAHGVARVPNAESSADDADDARESDEDEDGDGDGDDKGFFRRLLG